MVTAAQLCEYTKKQNKKPTELYTYIKHINKLKKKKKHQKLKINKKVAGCIWPIGCVLLTPGLKDFFFPHVNFELNHSTKCTGL